MNSSGLVRHAIFKEADKVQEVDTGALSLVKPRMELHCIDIVKLKPKISNTTGTRMEQEDHNVSKMLPTYSLLDIAEYDP